MNRPTDHQWRPPPFNNNAARGPGAPPAPPFPHPTNGRGGPRMMGNNNNFHRGGPNFRGGPPGRGPIGTMLPPPPPHMMTTTMMMNRARQHAPPAQMMPGRGSLPNNMAAAGRPVDPRGRGSMMRGPQPPPPPLAPSLSGGRGQPMRGGPFPGRGQSGHFAPQPPFHHGGAGPMKNGHRPLHAPPPPPPPPPQSMGMGALGGGASGGGRIGPGMPGRGLGRGMFPPPPMQQQQQSGLFRGPLQQQQQQHQQQLMPGFNGGRGLGPPPPPPPPTIMANHMRPPPPNSMPLFPMNNHLPPPIGSHGGHLLQQHQQRQSPLAFVNNAPSLQHPFAQQQQQQQQQQPIGPQQAAHQLQIGPVTANGGSQPTASFTKEQQDQAWTEHDAPDGRKYYHNSLTKQSVYEKPACLRVKDETAAAAAAALVERPWAEYEDPGTGKKYYSNGIITQWTKPTAMEQAENNTINTNNSAPAASDNHQVSLDANTTTAAPTTDSSLGSKKRRRAAAAETEFHNKEEATAAFKGLLLAKDVTPVQKWAEVIKMCSSDARWEACENVLTTGERKQALAEYQTKRANDLRTIERLERQRTREAFVQLLSDMLPSVPGFSARSSRFEDVRASLTKDDRFHAVPDESSRESLFLDFCEEFRKHEERKRHSKRRDAQDGFLSFLKENEESGRLTYASTWNSFVASLGDEHKRDGRFEVSNHMSDADRQLYFADFVIELQTAEDDKRRRIRDARKRAEKAQREAYRDTLTRLAEAKEIFPTSRWRDVDARLSKDPSYGPLNEQDREAPREIFQEFVDDWSESYRRDRSILGRIANQTSLSKNTNLATAKDLSYDEFSAALLEAVVDSAELHELRRIMNEKPISSARLYFDEIRQRVSSSRRGSIRQRDEESSEDEGEIVEDGEVEDLSENGSKKLDEEAPGQNAVVSTEVDLNVDA